jgi:ATP-binding protein involved in chromosome partitioning
MLKLKSLSNLKSRNPGYHKKNISIFGFEFGKQKEKVDYEKKVKELVDEEKKHPMRMLHIGDKQIKMPFKWVLAVASGKGGVGKSTSSVNIALGLNELGLKVGLIDGDLHSPSIPILMNLKDPVRQIVYDEKRHIEVMVPPMNYGIKCMSIGFLKPDGKAIIWKGPLIHYMLTQMVENCQWTAPGEPDLDVLVIDFPPGTGDSQLSLCQLIKIDAGLIITTPQDVALEDVRRGVDLFLQLNIPVFGVVENMSHFECSNCGHKDYIFGQDGYKKLLVGPKQNLEVPLIAQVPLIKEIRECSDAGRPIILAKPDSPAALIYKEIAGKIQKALKGKAVFEEEMTKEQKGTKFTFE